MKYKGIKELHPKLEKSTLGDARFTIVAPGKGKLW